jgi:hypothetical protein
MSIVLLFRLICRGDVEKTDTKNVASVSKMSAADHHLLLVICFVLVNPLAATPLFPHVSSVARARAVRSRGLFAAGSDSCTSPRFAERPC